MASESVDPFLDLSRQYEIVGSILPKLNYSSHKGQAGRIGVVGGCREYTGAPYFAAISALKVGCDLSFVFCTKDAAPVIKSYSPELIVYPVLDENRAIDDICPVLTRLHSLIIGPGLGRNPSIFPVIREIILQAKILGLPLVLDADALHYVSQDLHIIKGYRSAILTPNIAEFGRLYETVIGKPLSQETNKLAQSAKNVATALGNVTIVLKNERDIITDGNCLQLCTEKGSPRRCGGQGDLLSGSLGTFNYWSHQYAKENTVSNELSVTVVAALAACLLTKKCNSLAFASFGRSVTTTDMISQIGKAFQSVFDIV